MKNLKKYDIFNESKRSDISFQQYVEENGINKSTITLRCSNKNLTDLIGIEEFVNLKFLFCSNNKIKSLKGLEKLSELVELYCMDNELTSLIELKNCEDLTVVYCASNQITSLEGLENSPNIEKISFHHNLITSLDPVIDSNLSEMNCSKNPGLILHGIDSLTSLKTITCLGNPISLWIDYIDRKGNNWYVKLPKSLRSISSDDFSSVEKYEEWFKKNQPAEISKKFNF